MQKPSPAYNGDESYVFVCYAHEDSAEVYPQLSSLQEAGFRLWYDEGISPGHEWTQEIADAIDGAERLLYFVSPYSVASRHCRNEVQYALSHNKAIVSVHLLPTSLPGGLELSIGLDQAILRYKLDEPAYWAKLTAALGAPTPLMVAETTALAPKSKSLRFSLPVAALALVLAVGWWLWQKSAPDRSTATLEAANVQQAPLTAIAVLPFDDLSASQDQRWFARGMAAELIESLGRVSALRVASWSSTESLTRGDASLTAIGAMLSVGTIVTGSVRRSGERVTVVAEWMRISDQTRLWSARYDRRMDEIIDVQREIAIGIAEAIRTELGVDDATAGFFLTERYGTTDVRAWELAQRAWDTFQTWVPENFPAAIALAREALALDSDYAFVHGMLAYYDVDNPVTRVSGALRALALDPEDSYAHIILFEDSLANWDYETAEYLLDRAIENHPNNSILYWEAMYLYAGTGREQEALAAARRAVQLDPLWPGWHWHYGAMLINVGQPKNAVEALQEGQRLMKVREPGYQPFLHDVLAQILSLALHELGQEEAAREASLATKLVPAETLQEAWQRDGWRGYNLALAARHERLFGQQCVFLARADARERMYACLDELIARTVGPYQTRQELNARRRLPIDLRMSREFAPYRAEPRFQELVSRVQARIAEAAGTYALPSSIH